MKKEDTAAMKYMNPEIAMEGRIEDLLGRMTLEEKVRQLDQYFGASFVDKTHPQMFTVMADTAKIEWDRVREVIGEEGIGCIHDLYAYAEVNNELQKYAMENTRLGIPILFSEEALHGLCRPGCTVFPHAITQASSWNPDIVKEIGRGIAAETRSFGIHETFGPVLDVAREPRWGRVEETYGEDTYLASRMAVAMVKGLQGEELASASSIIAEPKHFAVHGIPEGGLNMSPCPIGLNEMFTYHLPVFEAAFVEGGAVNAMCSYNSIDGIPCAAHRFLLTDVLRNRWKMPGFVRSDLGAISRLERSHCTADSAEEAIRQALEAGTEMQYYDYSHEVYQGSLIQLVKDGKIGMDTLDTAVSRVLRVKFLLGLFENPYVDTGLSPRVVRCEKHGDVALTAAREGICLLKNDQQMLPLDKKTKKIAVIGPSADVARLGDYTPYIEGFEAVTLLQGITAIVSPNTTVDFARGTGILEDELEAITAGHLTDGNENPGLFGQYFNTPDLSGEPALCRIDPQINFNWVITKPDEKITAYSFSVRWTGKLVPAQSFSGYIGTASQDSMRLWINGELLLDGWGKNKNAGGSIPFVFEAGCEYDLRLEYSKDTNGAEVMLGWNRGEEGIEQAVEIARKADVAIVALGDSKKTCGECVDRSELCLPGRQVELLKAVHATGTPVVLVLQNGRPITLAWEAEHIPAILEAWYPGEKGGTAMAEVLFGDYNPAGRLPVSFPKSIGQLPVYYNRRRGGAEKYMDGDNKPLFAFGHGLSYTTFQYESLQITPDRIAPDGEVTVTFDVTNTGACSGDEVVQLYICDRVSTVVRPEKELKRFARVHLKPGEKKTISFALGFEELKLLGSDLQWAVEKGAFTVMVGPSSDHIALSKEFMVI